MTTSTSNRFSAPTWVAIILCVIGALNWGLVGLFSFDAVAEIFGNLSATSRFIYVLVAAAGTYLLVSSLTNLRQPHSDDPMSRPGVT